MTGELVHSHGFRFVFFFHFVLVFVVSCFVLVYFVFSIIYTYLCWTMWGQRSLWRIRVFHSIHSVCLQMKNAGFRQSESSWFFFKLFQLRHSLKTFKSKTLQLKKNLCANFNTYLIKILNKSQTKTALKTKHFIWRARL